MCTERKQAAAGPRAPVRAHGAHAIHTRLAGLWLFIVAAGSCAAPPIAGPGEEFTGVGQAIVDLLQSRDTARFARTLAPALEDWQAILATNQVQLPPARLGDLRDAVERQRQEVEESAKQILAVAQGNRWDFSKGRVQAQVVAARFRPLGALPCPGLKGQSARLPLAQEVQVIVSLETGSTNPASGLAVDIKARRLFKFPAGWRSLQGVARTVLAHPDSRDVKRDSDEMASQARMELDSAAIGRLCGRARHITAGNRRAGYRVCPPRQRPEDEPQRSARHSSGPGFLGDLVRSLPATAGQVADPPAAASGLEGPGSHCPFEH